MEAGDIHIYIYIYDKYKWHIHVCIYTMYVCTLECAATQMYNLVKQRGPNGPPIPPITQSILDLYTCA